MDEPVHWAVQDKPAVAWRQVVEVGERSLLVAGIAEEVVVTCTHCPHEVVEDSLVRSSRDCKASEGSGEARVGSGSLLILLEPAALVVVERHHTVVIASDSSQCVPHMPHPGHQDTQIEEVVALVDVL